MKFNRRAQSLIEYALLITLVLVAFVGIQVYLKRALKGRLKETADNIGEQFTANRDYRVETTQVSKRTEAVTPDGGEAYSTSEIQGGGFDMIGSDDGIDLSYGGHEANTKRVVDFDSGDLRNTNVNED